MGKVPELCLSWNPMGQARSAGPGRVGFGVALGSMALLAKAQCSGHTHLVCQKCCRLSQRGWFWVSRSSEAKQRARAHARQQRNMVRVEDIWLLTFKDKMAPTVEAKHTSPRPVALQRRGEYLVQVPAIPLCIHFLPAHILHAMVFGAPATHAGDPTGVSGSWLQLVQALTAVSLH